MSTRPSLSRAPLRAEARSQSAADAGRPILEVRQLCIRRDSTVILDQVDWRLGAGQHWAILGANGSGKTSLLSALTGYLTPTSGQIEVLGRRFGASDWRDLRCQVGLVSSSLRQRMAEDEPALYSVASGRYAMIDFWGVPSAEDQREARRLLKEVEGAHLEDRAWAVLSQGERQRVLIARALMAKPRILILDEPCAGLDPVARDRFLQFVERWGRQPGAPTLILVTHHIEEICPLFSHALLIRQGKVIGNGPIRPLLNSKNLTAVFGQMVQVRRVADRYQLTVKGSSEHII